MEKIFRTVADSSVNVVACLVATVHLRGQPIDFY